MEPQFFNTYKVNSPFLELSATKVPWDTKAFGFPVASIDTIKLYHDDYVNEDFEDFINWCEQEKIKLVSCRLPHDDMRSIMFLESQSFRFIEMVLHPIIHIKDSRLSDSEGFIVEPVGANELTIVSEMAENAFGFERYHIDPRINSNAADLRYGSWVKNIPNHSEQRLVKISKQENILGFFIIQQISEDTFHWHLTALNPEFVGKGFGIGVWSAMISYCGDMGARYAQTTISARNIPVLNLYSRLNARFGEPEVTFHWVAEKH